MELTGKVERRVVAKGTKSERATVVLVASNGEFILRRCGGSPFGADDSLTGMVGLHVQCQGEMLAGSTFEASSINPLEKPKG